MQDFCCAEKIMHTIIKILCKKASLKDDTYLILIYFTVLQFRFALLLKCDNNQGHENVNEEEWKYYEINDVEYGHFNAKVLNWTPILVGSGH
jgi:hypothetical protein